MGDKKVERRVLVRNRKAHHDYEIIDTVEAGLVLTGTEIKSIRRGKAHLKEAHARVLRGEVMLFGMHVSPFAEGNRHNVDPLRERKLLLHRREIDRLAGRVKQEGLTLVPLSIYVQRGWAKVELALVRGKKRYDKRATAAKRDAQRSMERARKVLAQ